MPVPRWISRPLLVGAAFMAFAIGVNHHDNPCTDAQVGAAGMCVAVQAGGAR